MNNKLKEEIKELLKEILNQDSIEIGNSKTGVVKVYFNADDKSEAEQRLNNAIALLLDKRTKILGVI